jgi:hypothetical protein
MTPATEGLARSVQTRLVAHAKAIGADPNLVLARFATERLLYRLSRSPYAERFVLKGALLLLAWFGETLRSTRDADLLGFGDLSDAALTRVFQDVCAQPVAQDGLLFPADSIRVSAIRLEDPYGGRRVTLQGELGRARLRVQVDVGMGDIVVPAPEWLEYPSLLGLPRPRLRAYRREPVVAEKQSQWLGFLRRSGVSGHPGELGALVDALGRFLGPPLGAAASASQFGTAGRQAVPGVANAE